VRRIAFWGMPSNFFGMQMKIAPFDRTDERAMDSADTLEDYLES